MIASSFNTGNNATFARTSSPRTNPVHRSSGKAFSINFGGTSKTEKTASPHKATKAAVITPPPSNSYQAPGSKLNLLA